MFIVNGVSGASLHCINFGVATDPCCGSGGMFVQSAKFVDAHQGNRKEITIYGQENSQKSYRLARMNLAIRGLSCNLGEENADSFLHDLHPKLLADYILANPPFNLKAWRTERQLTEDDRWKGYATPPVGNANYAWILHMLSHLSYDGTAAFLLANGALNAGVEGEAEYEIRKKLIQDNKVEAIIVLPRDMFYATDISVTLWLCGNHKKAKKVRRNGTEVMLRNRENEILFIDARTLGDGGNNDDGYTLLTEADKERIANTIFAWQSPEKDTLYHDVPEFCYSATNEEIERNSFNLAPSKYVEFVDHSAVIDYLDEMNQIKSKMQRLMNDYKKSQKELETSFGQIANEKPENIRQTAEYFTLKNHLEICSRRNGDALGLESVRGVSIQKKFINTKADMDNVSLKSYWIVKPGEFCYVPITSRNGDKISLAINDSCENYLVSSTYVVFRVKDTNKLNPKYLFLWLSTSEFDRYARFNSWGSARESFDWSALENFTIPVPSMEIQNSIVSLLDAQRKAEIIFKETSDIVNRIFPVFVSGFLK